MFSFLVALALYMTVGSAHAAAKAPPPSLAMFLSSGTKTMTERPAGAPAKKDQRRLGVETTAESTVVIDWETGATLTAKNADAPVPIASLTKLMTAIVALEASPGADTSGRPVRIEPSDHRPGGVPHIATGEEVTFADLLNLSLVASSNVSAAALARATGLSAEEFVARMNAKARQIGMTVSRFVEPTGLDPGNVASATDAARLLRRALEDERIRDAVTRADYAFSARTGKPHHVRSTDALIGSFLDAPPYVFLGGKTGYLDEAGYCFGAAAQNGEGNRVIAVVLGAKTRDDRFNDVKGLLYWAFDAYQWPKR